MSRTAIPLLTAILVGSALSLSTVWAEEPAAAAVPVEAETTPVTTETEYTTTVTTGDQVALKSDHPERYTVVKGDTLWDIAARFLSSPWQWAKVWKINEQVENPHLIYPGDVILLRWVDGQPQLTRLTQQKVAPPPPSPTPTVQVPDEQPRKPAEWPKEEPVAVPIPKPDLDKPRITIGDRERLQPKVRSSSREAAIPTIDPSAIGPFLTRPLVVGRNELERAGYVTIGRDNRRALGTNDEFYARGLDGDTAEYYYIFRKGRRIQSPGSQRTLGYEAVFLGEAKMLDHNKGRRNASKLIVTKAVKEILPTDRLWPVGKTPPLPYYLPRAPKNNVKGSIVLGYDQATQLGAMSIAVIDLGEVDGLEQGHVLRIWRHVGEDTDPVTGRKYTVPDEPTGLMLVFRTFKRSAYGLVMSADRPVHIHDVVTKP
ncbi:MAG: LysM peptidoglycan-binding domain-containing protein [Gammaproteobacteria bacterium]|nr:LysM peptidoglycan-binding domain-containing protein [Gammaproteobacteria bacterium]